jgi:hypothetical protein
MGDFKDAGKIMIISHIVIKEKDTNKVLLNKSDNKEVKTQ